MSARKSANDGADWPILTVNDDFTPLVLGDFTGTLNGMVLRRVD